MPNDPSLQELFRHEAQGIVDQLELLLNAGTPEAAAEGLRLAHTLKGLAAATEAKPLRDLARSLEAALDGFEPGDEARNQALLEAVDAARGLLEAAEGSGGVARDAAAALEGPAAGAPRHGVPQARQALWLRMRPSLRALGRSAQTRLKSLESGRDPRRRRRELGHELELWCAAAGLLGHTGAAASGLELASFLQQRAIPAATIPTAQALCSWFCMQIELDVALDVPLGAEGLATVGGLRGATSASERFGLAVEFPWPDVDLPADFVQAVDRACGGRRILDARPARPSSRFVRGILGLSTRRSRRRGDGAIQVSRQRLDRLLELAEELVALRVRTRRLATNLRQLATRPRDEANLDLSRLAHDASELDRELDDLARANQQAVLRARRVPLRGLYSLVRVTVREFLTRHPDKACRLEVEGAENRVDKGVLDLMVDPVLQLVRNALQHGIAPREERRARGKPEVARLRLTSKASPAGLLLEVSDDGEGLDLERLERAARRRGLLLLRGSRDALTLAFAPGVTTAEAVTDDAGRGVGLASVLERVRALRGRLTFHSVPGEGTRARLAIPPAASTARVLLVRTGREVYAIPLGAVLGVQEGQAPIWAKRCVQLSQLVDPPQVPDRRRGMPLPAPREGERRRKDRVTVQIAAVGSRDPEDALHCMVDDVLRRDLVVVRPLGRRFAPPGIEGAALLGDGRIVLVVDVWRLHAGGQSRALQLPRRTP